MYFKQQLHKQTAAYTTHCFYAKLRAAVRCCMMIHTELESSLFKVTVTTSCWIGKKPATTTTKLMKQTQRDAE